MNEPFDLAVIGGGVNGAGIARDAAGRGLRVLLCEKDDLAEGTSSRSGKLVHGGLRYLEYYEFRLVREALIEREVLLRAAPHIIWPMRFVLPHTSDQRPAWLIRLGLFLYDHLGGRKILPPTRKIDLRTAPEGKALKEEFELAFEYSDCWVDDARLVVLNAIDAQRRGADIRPRTRLVSARTEGGLWHLQLRSRESGEMAQERAQAVVNAAGPWVNEVLGQAIGRNSQRRVRLVKGSHIVTEKFWEGDQAYLLQNHDKRVIFVNPYENGKTLIGTTDIAVEGDPGDVVPEESEFDYLLSVINRYFKTHLSKDDILYSFAGVRPLYDDNADNPSAVTRDYVFDVEPETPKPGDAALLSVFGGKITTYRKLAEHALDQLEGRFPKAGPAWTANAVLPGGEIENADFEAFDRDNAKRYPWLEEGLRRAYGRRYGSEMSEVIGAAAAMRDLGRFFGGGLYQREADYLIEREWAREADDILLRRTKHGLHLTAAERRAFETYVASRAAGPVDA